VLSDQHLEDDPIDRVVLAVVGEHPHLGPLLAEPIHAALTLLVARGVPRQVVVHHRVEVLLQVDALGETVGADQDVLAVPNKRGNAVLSLCRWQRPGDGFHASLLR